MTVERIDGAKDPRAAAYRDLRDADLLRERGLFAAEGRVIVRRVIEGGRYAMHSLLVNDAALRDLAPAIARLDADAPIFVCPTEAFPALTGFDLHRGCVALVHRPAPTPVDALIAGARTIIVLEGIANADNVGGVFRNAAAFGADGVLLSPTCCDPLYRKAIRTSMGAALHVPFARAGRDEWPAVLTRVRAAGFTIVALTPREPSETLEDFAARWDRESPPAGGREEGPPEGGRHVLPDVASGFSTDVVLAESVSRTTRIALIIGAEGAGLTPAVEAAADYRVRIPISDRVDSLNLAVAAGIALHALMKNREPGNREPRTENPEP
jgi:tRNA G18 (ribose-2'-O)-methylase SpoU